MSPTPDKTIASRFPASLAHKVTGAAKFLGITPSEFLRLATEEKIVRVETAGTSDEEDAPISSLFVPLVERLEEHVRSVVRDLEYHAEILQKIKIGLTDPSADVEALLTQSEDLLAASAMTATPPAGYGPVMLCNTNRTWNPHYEGIMLSEKMAMASYGEALNRFKNNVIKGSRIILYANVVGSIARGVAADDAQTRHIKGDPQGSENEAFARLVEFRQFGRPLPAKDMKQIMGYDVNLRKTLIVLPRDAGEALWAYTSAL